MNSIIFTVQGDPKGKGRPRITTRGKFATMYQPKETVNWENWIKVCFQQEMAKTGFQPILEGAISVDITCYFAYPKSLSQKKRNGMVYVTKKPDADNIFKLMDALNGLAWHDDAQIARGHCEKIYDPEGNARTVITIRAL